MDDGGGSPTKGDAGDEHSKAVPAVSPAKSDTLLTSIAATLGSSSATATPKGVKRQEPTATPDDGDQHDSERSPKRLRQNEPSRPLSSPADQLTKVQMAEILKGLVACAPRFAWEEFELKEPGARLLKILRIERFWTLLHLDVEKGAGSLYDSYATESCKQTAAEKAGSFIERYGLPGTPSWTFEECPRPNDVSNDGVFALANAVYIVADMPLPATYDPSFWRPMLTLFCSPEADSGGGLEFVDFLADRYRLSLVDVNVPEGMSNSHDCGRRLETHFWEAKRKSSEIKSTLLLLRSLYAKYMQAYPEQLEALYDIVKELEELKKCKASFECSSFPKLEFKDHLAWRKRMIADYEMEVKNATIKVDWFRWRVYWGAKLQERLEMAIEFLEAKQKSWEALDQYLRGQADIMFPKGPKLEEATKGL